MNIRLLSTILLIIASLCGSISIDAQRTTRKGLKVAKQMASKAASADTTHLDKGMISVAGYDKPLRSNKESLFVTNNTSTGIQWLELRIDYTDMQGRQLHRAIRRTRCDIPAGETRQITFPSWDKQKTLYYHRSGKPRRSDGTPYDIKCTPLRAIFTNDTTD